ncbi:hypothetical protein HPP92_028618 [Vanilla planifolia]|uniref:Uncharacterized protein n=1 Tax=Vanilla planifolia TaxID=51239 RepID=A0A835U3V6_VANPL|nr:hypothetical protein HPP92_028618 [Vanilla planifolia]
MGTLVGRRTWRRLRPHWSLASLQQHQAAFPSTQKFTGRSSGSRRLSSANWSSSSLPAAAACRSPWSSLSGRTGTNLWTMTLPSSNHLQNFDHAFMSLTFLLYATFAAALDRANPARPAAEPLTILAASTAFAQGLLLFHLPPPTTLAWRPVPLAPSAGHRRLARHHSLGHQPPEELCGRIRSVLDHCLPGDMAHHHGIRPLYAVADVQGVLHQPRKRAHGGPMPKPGGAPPRQGAEYASIVKLVDDDVEDLDVEANMRSFVSMGKTMRSMDLEM